MALRPKLDAGQIIHSYLLQTGRLQFNRYSN